MFAVKLISSKAAVGFGLFLLLLVTAWCLYGPHNRIEASHIEQFARTVRSEGPWYYVVAKRTHTARLIPTRLLDTDKLESQITRKRWQAVMSLSRLGTNAWPAVPALVGTVARKNIYIGLAATEALVGVKADECPDWVRIREELRGQTNGATTFRYLVTGRNMFGKTYDSAHRRFGLVGLAATGPAAGIAYADVVDVFKYDKELELRACAAMVLGGLEAEKKPTVALLKQVFQDKEEWPAVSAAAGLALVTAVPKEAETRDLLRQGLQDQRSAVPLASARGLWQLRAPAEEVLPVMTALLNHRLASTRFGALKGLSEMGSAARSSVSEVQRLTSDENESVRRAAAEALKHITEPAKPGSH